MDVSSEIKDAVDSNVAANDTKAEVVTSITDGGPANYFYKAQEGTKLVTFDQALKDFVGSTASSMRSARLATDLAIVHYFNTGDLSYCQRFLDAIPKNYVRRTAYLSWLQTYAPIQIVKDRLFKDKTDEAKMSYGGCEKHPMNEDHVNRALAKSFWDHKPEPVEIEFGEGDIITQLLKAASTMRGKRYNLTDAAVVKLEAAEKMLISLQ